MGEYLGELIYSLNLPIITDSTQLSNLLFIIKVIYLNKKCIYLLKGFILANNVDNEL